MPDIVASIFRLKNERGYFVPRFEARYIERNTGQEWIINCGGTRAYFIRVGEQLEENVKAQSADSHFMANRITRSLFISGCGFFKAEAQGRIIFKTIKTSEFNFFTHLDLRDDTGEENKKDKLGEITDWYEFICQNTFFRRAVDDAYYALENPLESDFFIYRGMEWLLKAGNIGWQELADYIGITFKEIKKFKQQVNVELGQRHGVDSGKKRRAMLMDYGPFIADFLFGLCNVRKSVDENFLGYTAEKTAKIVMKAIPAVPYP